MAKDNTSEKKKNWFAHHKFIGIVLVVILIAIAVSSSQGSSKSTSNASKTAAQTAAKATTPKLTLDDGWTFDNSNQYATFVDGYVSNNTAKAITNYVQITFNAYDTNGANVGDCLANTNTVDANGKWKFHAICSAAGAATVKFKEISGF